MKLYLFRHGESRANLQAEELVTGRASNTPLTSRGEDQARKLGAHFRSTIFRSIFSSTALRARSTGLSFPLLSFSGHWSTKKSTAAKLFMEQLEQGPQEYSEHEELEEIDMGEFTGMRRDEVYVEHRLKEIEANPWYFKPPRGESQFDVEQRIKDFVDRHILRLTDSNQTNHQINHYNLQLDKSNNDEEESYAIFGHGLLFKCFLRFVNDSDPALTWRIRIDNTAFTLLEFQSPSWRLLSLNQCPHLL